MKRLWVDANVLLRFLTQDPPALAERSAKLMRQAEQGEVLLTVPLLVVAEMVWVLKSFYRHSLTDICHAIVPLLSAEGIEAEDRELAIQALELARDRNVDFVDAVLSLRAARSGESVCTFDETDFKRLPAHWLVPR